MAAESRRKAVSPLPHVKCPPLDCNSRYLTPLADHPGLFQQNPVRKEWVGCLPRTTHLSVVTFCGHLLSRRHDWLLLSQSLCKQIWQVSWEVGDASLWGSFPFTRECWEEEVRGGKRCVGRKQECVDCKKKDWRLRQDLNENYSILFPPLRWEITGRFKFAPLLMIFLLYCQFNFSLDIFTLAGGTPCCL